MRFFSNYKKLVISGFIGDISATLISVLTSLFLVNFVDDVLYGSYVYGLAIAIPLITFSSISGESVVLSDNNLESKKEIFYTRIKVAFVVIPLLFLISYFDNSNTIPWFLLVFIYLVKLLENISRLLYSYLYLEDKIKLINIFKIINQSLFFIGLGIISSVTQSITYGLVFVFFTRIFLIYIQINGVNKYLDFNLQRLFILKINKKFIFLGFIAFLHSFNTSIPKIILQNIYGVQLMSVLGAVLLIPSFVEVIFTSVNKTVRNRISKMIDDYQDTNSFIFKILYLSIAVVCVLSILLILLQDFLPLLLSSKIEGNLFNVILILLGTPFLISSYNFYFILIKEKKFKILFQILIMLSIISAFSSYLLINNFGLIGFSYNYLVFSSFYYLGFRYLVKNIEHDDNE